MKETDFLNEFYARKNKQLKQALKDADNECKSPTAEEMKLPYYIKVKRIVFNDGAEQRIEFALLWYNDLVDVYEFNNVSFNGTKDTDKIIVAINKMIRFWQHANTIEIGASETKDFIVFKIENYTGDLYYRKFDIENALEVAECLNNLLPSIVRIEDLQADAECM